MHLARTMLRPVLRLLRPMLRPVLRPVLRTMLHPLLRPVLRPVPNQLRHLPRALNRELAQLRITRHTWARGNPYQPLVPRRFPCLLHGRAISNSPISAFAACFMMITKFINRFHGHY